MLWKERNQVKRRMWGLTLRRQMRRLPLPSVLEAAELRRRRQAQLIALALAAESGARQFHNGSKPPSSMNVANARSCCFANVR
ncbi:MAG: hypothetical protein HYY96_07720 [Candidatus Tectomicrobia bacterium]|nr:hypothetical protein [Candidatus Tectomicrobia bacterium]